jgi:hypothetical protein
VSVGVKVFDISNFFFGYLGKEEKRERYNEGVCIGGEVSTFKGKWGRLFELENEAFC